MITAAYDDNRPSASSLALLHSDVTHAPCPSCRYAGPTLVAYCPGCTQIDGRHFHRPCPRCQHEWLERSAWHLRSLDVAPDDPTYALVCQHCGRRAPSRGAILKCCARTEISPHDLSEPCALCVRFVLEP